LFHKEIIELAHIAWFPQRHQLTLTRGDLGMTSGHSSAARPLVSKPTLARELDATTRSIDRWAADPRMKFPTPLKMNRRIYFFRDEIENWKLSRVRASIGEAA
jgi:hypothetical protein